MYLRVKRRKNKTGTERAYLYAVVSKHTKRSQNPRQKVLAYLGKIVVLKTQQLQKGPEHQKTTFKQEIKELFVQHLKSMAFTEKNNQFEHDNIVVDMNTGKVQCKGQPLCISANNGFLCDLTLQRLLWFEPPRATETEIGQYLAKCLVEAGIGLKESEFVRLFGILNQELAINNSQQSTTNKNNYKPSTPSKGR